MNRRLWLVIAVIGGLAIFPFVSSLINNPASAAEPAFVIQQFSYQSKCAEEDNVILKISPAIKDIKGVNILAKKPVFNTKEYVVSNEADFTGCDWWQNENHDNKDYYPGCSAGYIDRNNVCQQSVVENVFDDGKWQIVARRSAHWQPFMSLINQDNQPVAEYKSLSIRRFDPPGSGGEPSTVAVIYSDGYLRPVYFSRPNEPGGWGGSFILGDSKFIQLITPRYYNNVKQVKILRSTNKDLNLELIFADNPDHAAKLVVHYDYDKNGIDYFAPENKKELLSFVSMYRDKTSFDIEFLTGEEGGKALAYNVIDPLINGISFTSSFLLGKHNPSKHNTLSPDFQMTGIYAQDKSHSSN
jgi:hypothetical protein